MLVAKEGETINKKYPILTDSRILTLDSRRNQLKGIPLEEWVFRGSVTLPASVSGGIGARASVVIPHGFGYVPFIDATAKGQGDTLYKTIPNILIGLSCPDIYCGTIQGTNETVLVFYTIDPTASPYGMQEIAYEYKIKIDPSKDAWDS